METEDKQVLARLARLCRGLIFHLEPQTPRKISDHVTELGGGTWYIRGQVPELILQLEFWDAKDLDVGGALTALGGLGLFDKFTDRFAPPECKYTTVAGKLWHLSSEVITGNPHGLDGQFTVKARKEGERFPSYDGLAIMSWLRLKEAGWHAASQLRTPASQNHQPPLKPSQKPKNKGHSLKADSMRAVVLNFLERRGGWDGTYEELSAELAKQSIDVSDSTLSRYLKDTKYQKKGKPRRAQGKREREAVSEESIPGEPLESWTMPDDEVD